MIHLGVTRGFDGYRIGCKLGTTQRIFTNYFLGLKWDNLFRVFSIIIGVS